MTVSSDNIPIWSTLGEAARAGELMLERGTAMECARRCDDFLAGLGDLRARASRLAHVDGFGQLPSGVALSAKFGNKASGGDASLDRVLASHIKIVKQMRDVFLSIESRYAAAEEANTTAVTAAGSPIN